MGGEHTLCHRSFIGGYVSYQSLLIKELHMYSACPQGTCMVIIALSHRWPWPVPMLAHGEGAMYLIKPLPTGELRVFAHRVLRYVSKLTHRGWIMCLYSSTGGKDNLCFALPYGDVPLISAPLWWARGGRGGAYI